MKLDTTKPCRFVDDHTKATFLADLRKIEGQARTGYPLIFVDRGNNIMHVNDQGERWDGSSFAHGFVPCIENVPCERWVNVYRDGKREHVGYVYPTKEEAEREAQKTSRYLGTFLLTEPTK